MTVRLAVGADAARLAELAAATFPLACPPTTTRADMALFIANALSAEAFEGYLADPDRALLVDDPGIGGPLGGYTMLVGTEPTDPDVLAGIRIRPTAEISKIYLRADQHGSGAAGLLLQETMRVASDRGAAGVWLGTNQGNARALRFYEKHGFEIVGRKRFKLGEVYEDDFVLERRLP